MLPATSSQSMLRRLVTQSTERLLREPSPAKSTMRDTRPLITRWRTRLCLLMLYASVSIVVSIVNVLTSLLQASLCPSPLSSYQPCALP